MREMKHGVEEMLLTWYCDRLSSRDLLNTTLHSLIPSARRVNLR